MKTERILENNRKLNVSANSKVIYLDTFGSKQCTSQSELLSSNRCTGFDTLYDDLITKKRNLEKELSRIELLKVKEQQECDMWQRRLAQFKVKCAQVVATKHDSNDNKQNILEGAVTAIMEAKRYLK